jgi:hypothetical protein
VPLPSVRLTRQDENTLSYAQCAVHRREELISMHVESHIFFAICSVEIRVEIPVKFPIKIIIRLSLIISKERVKLSLQQTMEAHRVVRRRGSHIF